MKLKTLFSDRYEILAVMDGEDCPAEDFLSDGEASTAANRIGLMEMLGEIAQRGFDDIPASWTHEADKSDKIMEFVKGRLRLFYFKGDGRQIVVCVDGTLKTTKKADSKIVKKAAKMRKDYFEALEHNEIVLVIDNGEDCHETQ